MNFSKNTLYISNFLKYSVNRTQTHYNNQHSKMQVGFIFYQINMLVQISVTKKLVFAKMWDIIWKLKKK